MTMIAIKPITKGQEIFNDYGQLPRSDLLRTYGYITDNYKKWDVVEIGVETIIETAIAHFAPGESQKNARVSRVVLLSETTLTFIRFSSQTIGRCMITGMTYNANPVVRLPSLNQLSCSWFIFSQWTPRPWEKPVQLERHLSRHHHNLLWIRLWCSRKSSSGGVTNITHR